MKTNLEINKIYYYPERMEYFMIIGIDYTDDSKFYQVKFIDNPEEIYHFVDDFPIFENCEEVNV